MRALPLQKITKIKLLSVGYQILEIRDQISKIKGGSLVIYYIKERPRRYAYMRKKCILLS